MKLKTPIKYDSHVRPVCLAKSDFDAGTNCFVTGWGHTSEGGNIARVNRELSSQLFPFNRVLKPATNRSYSNKTVRLNAIFVV